MLTPTAEMTDAGILIRDGVIEELGLREGMRLPDGAEEISATDRTAIPGFVDVHIHGAGGRDVMEGSAGESRRHDSKRGRNRALHFPTT